MAIRSLPVRPRGGASSLLLRTLFCAGLRLLLLQRTLGRRCGLGAAWCGSDAGYTKAKRAIPDLVGDVTGVSTTSSSVSSPDSTPRASQAVFEVKDAAREDMVGRGGTNDWSTQPVTLLGLWCNPCSSLCSTPSRVARSSTKFQRDSSVLVLSTTCPLLRFLRQPKHRPLLDSRGQIMWPSLGRPAARH